jgi:hypothetical protein
METSDNRPRDEGESHDDRRLVEELESLYHEVARSDHPDSASEKGIEDLHSGKMIPRLYPDGAISDIDPAAETTRRHRDQNPPYREALMERLNKIRGAYEMMLTYWPYASGDSPMAGIKKT